jgi:hypothetical protein
MTSSDDQELLPGQGAPPPDQSATPPTGQLAPWAVPRPPARATPPASPTPQPVPAEHRVPAEHPVPAGEPVATVEPGPVEQAAASVEPAVEESARRRLPRVPWRRFALAGLLLVALGLSGGGFAVGWVTHAALGSTVDGDTTVDVVSAPDGADAIDTALPDVRGLPVVDARQAIADLGLPADAITAVETPSAQTEGTVVRQDPIGGTAKAASVTLFVAVPGEVPALVGQSSDEADRALTGLGVRVERRQVYDPTVAEGTVTALDPPPGSPLPLVVTVTVAGPASSLYLDELDSIDGGCAGDQVAINGQSYQHALTCSPSSFSSDPRITTYLVDRLTASVEGVIGITDESDPELTVAVSVVGDGRLLWSSTLRYGESTPFAADTRGVLRLEIRHRMASEEGRGSFAIGDARAVGAPADVTTLRAQ